MQGTEGQNDARVAPRDHGLCRYCERSFPELCIQACFSIVWGIYGKVDVIKVKYQLRLYTGYKTRWFVDHRFPFCTL